MLETEGEMKRWRGRATLSVKQGEKQVRKTQETVEKQEVMHRLRRQTFTFNLQALFVWHSKVQRKKMIHRRWIQAGGKLP